MEKELSHLNKKGEAHMVDIGAKSHQFRRAVATGKINLQPTTLQLINSNNLSKGDVFSVARIAGIMAAKNTSALIPLCHQVPLNHVTIAFSHEEDGIRVVAVAECAGMTGVEMEALTAASVSLLTIYDMCKAVDKEMVLGEIKLTEKVKK